LTGVASIGSVSVCVTYIHTGPQYLGSSGYVELR
jgi:hypothetical protein